MMPAAPPERFDDLTQAIALLLLALGLTILPAVTMTADHWIRQKPGVEHQAAVFAHIGLSSPCFFPSGHPARNMLGNANDIDWRPTPTLPLAPPGPADLVRPSTASRRLSSNGR